MIKKLYKKISNGLKSLYRKVRDINISLPGDSALETIHTSLLGNNTDNSSATSSSKKPGFLRRFNFLRSRNNQIGHIISDALSTQGGRGAMAQAMVEPIRRALNYQAVGRRLLMVEELPQGALPRYDNHRFIEDSFVTTPSVAYVVPRNPPNQITEGEEVLIPTFDLEPHPTVHLDEIRNRRFNIIDRHKVFSFKTVKRQHPANSKEMTKAIEDVKAQLSRIRYYSPDVVEKHDKILKRLLVLDKHKENKITVI